MKVLFSKQQGKVRRLGLSYLPGFAFCLYFFFFYIRFMCSGIYDHEGPGHGHEGGYHNHDHDSGGNPIDGPPHDSGGNPIDGPPHDSGGNPSTT